MGAFTLEDPHVTARTLRYPRLWHPTLSEEDIERAIADLEQGKALYFPHLAFATTPEVQALLSPRWSNGRKKNISCLPQTGQIKGLKADPATEAQVRRLMQRYADLTHELVRALFPEYGDRLRRGRTSFRPVEVSGRPSSLAKDDTRLHVDAFPSRPTNGERILRVFCNFNPQGRTRNWCLGEPFQPYAERFAPRVSPPAPGTFGLMHILGFTKTRRSLYDPYMLQIHDLGKADQGYQDGSPQERFDFPARTTWLCFTNQVLHGVLSGQYLLGQTFNLPVAAQRRPEPSPLRVLERLTGRPLARPT